MLIFKSSKPDLLVNVIYSQLTCGYELIDYFTKTMLLLFQISQLVEEVSRLQQSLQRLQETSAQATARLEEELEARRQHISRIESKLERQRDYDDLKREISVLRSVDLSQIPTGEPGKSLEHLLMERSKALQQAENLKPSNTPDALGKWTDLYLILKCIRNFF